MDPLEDSSCWDFLDCSFFPDADNLINPSLHPFWPPNHSRQSFLNTHFCILPFLFSFTLFFHYTNHFTNLGFSFHLQEGFFSGYWCFSRSSRIWRKWLFQEEVVFFVCTDIVPDNTILLSWILLSHFGCCLTLFSWNLEISHLLW